MSVSVAEAAKFQSKDIFEVSKLTVEVHPLHKTAQLSSMCQRLVLDEALGKVRQIFIYCKGKPHIIRLVHENVLKVIK